MILATRTDAPEATLVLADDQKTIEHQTWTAGRQLSDQLLLKIEELLGKHKLGWNDLTGLIVFAGPGSFTGLRIGVTVANSLAYGLNIPVVGSSGDDWVDQGLKLLPSTKVGDFVAPDYGAEPNISVPKK